MTKALVVSLLSTVALLSFPAQAGAQVLCTLGPATPAAPFDSMADLPAAAEAQAELKKLKSLLCPKGCGKLFLFANATTTDTVTATDGRGVSKIAYSPGFLASVRKSYGPLGTLGILAHDLGHHLEAIGNRPAWMQGKEAWDSELRADAWAGCAMAKAELKPSGLQAALLVLSEHPSPRHPAWGERRAAITEGYKQCGGVVLPKLARETEKEAPEAAATATLAGCTSDRDCRNGRACVQSRCAAAPERRRCGKDTDCPEPQECDATGICAVSGSQARGPQEPAPQSGPLLAAALQTSTPRPQAAGDASSCLKACDEVRTMCVDAATSEGNRCLASIQAEPGYRSCSCPSYPAGNADCYGYCSAAYERGKGCATANTVRDCRSDGDRCRARC